jgi:hypothetical protein
MGTLSVLAKENTINANTPATIKNQRMRAMGVSSESVEVRKRGEGSADQTDQ